MKAVKGQLLDERGMVLVISLMIMALLFGAGVGAIVSTQADLRISGNLKTTAQAFYLADAGVEWAKQQIRDSRSNPVSPVGGTQNLPLGGFTVTFGSASKESQLVSSVTVRSTGNVGNSLYAIEALLRKTYDLTDGAIAIRGNEANSSFMGESFSVDGRDYDPETETLVVGDRAQSGISVPDAVIVGDLTGSLTSGQLGNIVGKGGTASNIEQSRFLPSDAVEQLAVDLCNHPLATVQEIPPSGTLVVSGATSWGTRSAPQLRCIQGLTTGPYATTDVVETNGDFSGAGFLVVRNADLVTSDAFRWEGLILISGSNVGFRVEGGGEKNIYGSILIHERSNDAAQELKLQGTMNVRYSSSALLRATTLFSLTSDPLSAVYGSLPSSVSQVYWRAVSD